MATRIIDLPSLLPENGGDGTQGIVILGEQDQDQTDWSHRATSSAGDFNGDGYYDLIIGGDNAMVDPDDPNDPNDPVNQDRKGRAYVVFGKGDPLPPEIDLGSLDGTNGFAMTDEDNGERFGHAAGWAGDVNGDGLADLVIGDEYARTPGQDLARGRAYVVFGTRGPIPPNFDMRDLNGENGFVLVGGIDNRSLGYSVRSAGDINGDGYDDILVGDELTRWGSGDCYVVFGRPAGFPPALAVTSLDGTDGFVIRGTGQTGFSVSSAGDVNGDGYDDMLTKCGIAACVVYGRADGFHAEVIVGGPGQTILRGVATEDGTGFSVSSAGDVNGDGFADLLLGAPYADLDGVDSGVAYVVFGTAEQLPAVFYLCTLNGSNGFVLRGLDAGDRGGHSVSNAGDVNGDGVDDFLVGAPYADPHWESSGETYVVFGKPGGFPASLDLPSLEPEDGFQINGYGNYHLSGYCVNAAGDVNGDGFDDILVESLWLRGANDHYGPGEFYLIWGRDFANREPVIGTPGSDTLVGSPASDVLIGCESHDLLVGAGGDDVLIGGQGDDVLAVASTDFRRVAGGTGTDTLRLDGDDLRLNLPVIPDSRLTGLEYIDLSGQRQRLTLNVLDVLRFSDTSNTLIVSGDASDVIEIGGGWVDAGSEIIEGTPYRVFQQGAAILKVSVDIAFNASPQVTHQIEDVSVAEDELIEQQLDLSDAFSDPDVAHGDALTLSVSQNTNPTLLGTVWNGTTLTLTFAPNQNGDSLIAIRATDLCGVSVEQVCSVHVSSVNDPPQLVKPIPDVTLRRDETPAEPCIPSGSLVESLLACRNWISYSPSRPYNPEARPPVFPNENDIRTDLQLLHDEGWRGLVTYAMDGTLREIPRIAKEVGFTQVIAGLYWYDAEHLAVEWQAALEEVEYCDGYILGNEGLLYNPEKNIYPRYTRAELVTKIAALKALTGRPVSTTETSWQYLNDGCNTPPLISLGDWVAPNVHPWYPGIRDIRQAVQWTVDTYAQLRALAGEREVVVKESWWPTGGGDPAATPENQVAYFDGLIGSAMPFVFGEAFDLFWKTKEGAQGPHWGLHTSYRVPKSAISELGQVFITSYDAPHVDLMEYFADVDIATDNDYINWTVTNTNPELVTPRVYGNLLVLHFSEQPKGTAILTVRATDQTGEFVEDTFTVTVVDSASRVVGRYVVYNNSPWDGSSAALDDRDYQAIAPAPSRTAHGRAPDQNEPDKELGKTALLPGQLASFVNYTSYAKGLNGIVVAFDNLDDPEALTEADFEFRVGNSNAPSGWGPAPTPSGFRVQQDVTLAPFTGRPDVVTITWEDENPDTPGREAGAISNQWLQVRVLANARTGLEEDVFYFGNAIGEAGDVAGDTLVDRYDVAGAAGHPHDAANPASIADPYDFNRDKLVAAADQSLAASHSTDPNNCLWMLDLRAPGLPQVSVTASPTSVSEDAPGELTYTFKRSGPITEPAAITFRVTGTAEFPSDYAVSGAASFDAKAGTVTFAAGSATAEVTIDPLPDGVVEAKETAWLLVLPGANYALGSPAHAVGTIVNDDALIVTELTPTCSGFVARFNGEVRLEGLNLYDGAEGKLGPADVVLTAVLTDGSALNVAGSMVLADDRQAIEFVKTGEVLAAGTYTATIKSGVTAFRDMNDDPLDGDNDGSPGGDFPGQFTVPSSTDRVVSVPDMARGARQPVNIPNAASGLPIRLDNGEGVTSLAVDLMYDPNLLVITTATLTAGLPGDWTVVNPPDTSTPGVAKIRASGTTPLSGTNVEVVRLTAAVPDGAPYGDIQSIRLENVSLNSGAIPAVGDVAVHKAVYPGDADGSGIHSSADAFLIVQVALGLASGFAAHPWTDPRIIADVDGSDVLSAADAFLIVQEGLGQSEPFVPDNPHIGITPVGGGVDPQFRIDENLPASAGGLVSVPVNLDVEPSATNVGGFDFDLFFDSSQLTIQVPGGVSTGANTAGWAISSTLVAAGHLRVGMMSSSGQPLAWGLREIAQLQFHVEAGAHVAAALRDAIPVSERPGYVVALDIEPVDPRAGGYRWTASDGSLGIGAATDWRNKADPLEVNRPTEYLRDRLLRDLDTELPLPEDVLDALAADIGSRKT